MGWIDGVGGQKLGAGLVVVLALLLWPAVLSAQGVESGGKVGVGGSRVLVVGTKVAPPFALKGEDGAWRGIAIELWAEVAARLGIRYRLVETDLPHLISGLEDGSFDASVAALTVTAARERRIDFTHSFYSSGLGIAVATDRAGGWTAISRRLLDPRLLTVLGSLVLVLFGAGLLVWLFERRANPEQFPAGLRGLGAAFWWSAVTMTTVGYGDKAPTSLGGRIVGLFWMFAGIVMISSFTAAITSSLTVAQLATKVQGPSDLPRARVSTVAASTSEQYLEARHLRHESFPTARAALDALAEGRVDAMVYDRPILRYLVHHAKASLTVLPQTFARQDYAIALPQGSALREPVDLTMLEAISEPSWQNVLERYFGRQ